MKEPREFRERKELREPVGHAYYRGEPIAISGCVTASITDGPQCFASLHLWIEVLGASVLGSIEINNNRAAFADKTALANWLRQMAWDSLAPLLNPQRTFPPGQPGYFMIQARHEFREVLDRHAAQVSLELP